VRLLRDEIGGKRLRGALRLLPAAAALLTAACGEPAIEETLHLTLHGDGSSQVEFRVVFPEDLTGADEETADAIADLRRSYLEGWDPWARRFEEGGGAGETLHWERVGGELRSLTRTARFEDPGSLAAFFLDTDLAVRFDPDAAESELAIFPGTPSRATAEQEKRLEELLGTWSTAVVAYLAEVADLYAYLGADDARAESVFRAIFEEEDAGIDGAEEARLDRLIEAFLRVQEAGGQEAADGQSLERLARLVYDPFPARLSVSIEGRLLAVEGFVATSDGDLEVPVLGLEQAVLTLEERWVRPPLLTTYERLQRLGDEADFDVAAFARLPRSIADLPTAKEVSAAVEEALEPAPEYRVRWRPAATQDAPRSG